MVAYEEVLFILYTIICSHKIPTSTSILKACCTLIDKYVHWNWESHANLMRVVMRFFLSLKNLMWSPYDSMDSWTVAFDALSIHVSLGKTSGWTLMSINDIQNLEASCGFFHDDRLFFVANLLSQMLHLNFLEPCESKCRNMFFLLTSFPQIL